MMSLVAVVASMSVVINGPVAVQPMAVVNRAGPVNMMAKKGEEKEEKKPWSLAGFLNGPTDKFQGGAWRALCSPYYISPTDFSAAPVRVHLQSL